MIAGFKHSAETKRKIAKSHIGIRPTEEIKKKISLAKIGKPNGNEGKPAPWHLGNKYAKGNKPNRTSFKKGRISIPWNKGKKLSLEHAAKARIAALGTKRSLKTRKRISEAQRGNKGNNWKGGITPFHIKIRMSFEYKLWRTAVFERDNYTCIWCCTRNGNGKRVILNADHIKPFALFPELRFAIDNGRTLCESCHKTTDTYGRNIK
mgnify:CR=1 FL=1